MSQFLILCWGYFQKYIRGWRKKKIIFELKFAFNFSIKQDKKQTNLKL